MFPKKSNLGMEQELGRDHTGFVAFSKVLFVPSGSRRSGMVEKGGALACFCRIPSRVLGSLRRKDRFILLCFIRVNCDSGFVRSLPQGSCKC